MIAPHLQDKYVNLYADCMPVAGACKSAIYDLTRREIVRFPSVYLHILQQAQQHTIGSVLSAVPDEASQKSVATFLHFLMENEFINLSVEVEKFPRIDEIWERPSVIQNAIIDVNKELHDYASLFQQLDMLGCESVEIRCFSLLHTLDEIQTIVHLTYHTSIQGVEILLKYDPRYDDIDYIKIVESEPIIARLIVHSAPSDQEVMTTFDCDENHASIMKHVKFVKEQLTSHKHCGVIQLSTMNNPTTHLFFENKLYNGCLNRKISIDQDGFVKNCPSMQASFGHHKTVSLIEVVKNDVFKEMWYLHKDKIKKCQDCEFRYACTDCRAYVEDPHDRLSKPLKCGYDPYKGTWAQWHSQPEKDWVIKYYACEEER